MMPRYGGKQNVMGQQTKIIRIIWTSPHICLQESLAQSVHAITLYTRRKLNLPFIISLELQCL